MKKLICILLSVLMLLSSVVFAQATELSRAEQLALIEYQNYIDDSSGLIQLTVNNTISFFRTHCNKNARYHCDECFNDCV